MAQAGGGGSTLATGFIASPSTAGYRVPRAGTNTNDVDRPLWGSDTVTALREIETFLTGAPPRARGDRVLATIMVLDIVGSTTLAATMGDERWKVSLSEHRYAVRRELARFEGHEVDTAGDGFMTTFEGPARAVRCALAVRDASISMGMSVRVGIHTGECVKLDDGIAGLAVHIAARVAAEAMPNSVLATRTVQDLVVGSGLQFESIGERELRGVPGRWELFKTDESHTEAV